MRECRKYGSVRGGLGNQRSYRDPFLYWLNLPETDAPKREDLFRSAKLAISLSYWQSESNTDYRNAG